ncbi:MAG: AAA family ATPase, partial [Actinobacteria bacterium]|nr:AAA family ATPase [Actinomycetota bacterium]
ANGSVIMIAATNRPDILDPALLRPGRFDRQIPVDRPDLKGREAILKIHAQNKPLANDVDLLNLARRTPGFTGADLANVINEAALLTARKNLEEISNEALGESIDRVMAGPQKVSRLMNERERLITAYHEGGHALVAHALPDTDPVQKITIMPRGRALGYTMVLPDEDKYSKSRNQMLDELAYTLGGRAAEELIFHDPTTGAANDIEKATTLSRAMVMEYGLSERIGAIKLGSASSEPFVGMSYGHQRDYSEEIAAIIDEEVRELIDNAHQEAYEILVANREILDALVLELMEKETLEKEEVARVFAEVKARPARKPWTGSKERKPSKQPPVIFEKE